MASLNSGDTPAGHLGAWGDLPFAANPSALLEQWRFLGIDLGAWLEWQRDDWDALAQANRQVCEGLVTLSERCNEMQQKTMLAWQEGLAGATGPEAWSRSIALWQASLGQALDDFRELAQMQTQAHADAWKVLQDRLQENMAHLQQMLQPR